MSESINTGRSVFIADLHLTDKRPEANGRFFHFLEHVAKTSDALYILGDLFEYWVGDDDAVAGLPALCAEKIRAVAESGTPVYFMHGNRDFLLEQRYAQSSHMQLLPDPFLIDLYGTPTLLTHGDILCTDDTRYQKLRKLLRQSWLKTLLQALPLNMRHKLAGQARAGSERAKSGKPYDIMDVNKAAVLNAFKESGARRMIHGHTHRPAQHDIQAGENHYERWVLHDWYTTGGYLVCTATGCELVSLA